MVTPLPTNPLAGISAFIDPRRQALLGLASGLVSGNNWNEGLGQGFAMAAQGKQADDAYATSKKEEAERAKQLNYTIQAFQKAGRQDLVDKANAGFMAEAWNDFTKGGPEPTASMRDFEYSQKNPAYAEFLNPAKPPDLPSAVDEYNFAVSQGYDGDYTKWKTEVAKAGATSIDLNANQSAAAAYADRMAAANAVLSDPQLEAAQTNIVESGKAGIPVIGNFLTSEDKKLADQAQRDFINAVLRRESGAVISPSEFENAKQQYFPQPGDTQAVKDQKRANRELAIKGVARAAGSNYSSPGSGADYKSKYGLE